VYTTAFDSKNPYTAFISQRELEFFPFPAVIHLVNPYPRWDATPIHDWLLQQVGPYKKFWSYSHIRQQDVYDCCVAFSRDPDRTLFLLRWGTD